MATIQIKTPSPDQAIPLVKDALAMETKLTRDSLRTTEDRITQLTQQLDVTPEQILTGTVRRTEDNEALLLDLEGELELRRVLQDTLRHLEQTRSMPVGRGARALNPHPAGSFFCFKVASQATIPAVDE